MPERWLKKEIKRASEDCVEIGSRPQHSEGCSGRTQQTLYCEETELTVCREQLSSS